MHLAVDRADSGSSNERRHDADEQFRNIVWEFCQSFNFFFFWFGGLQVLLCGVLVWFSFF